MRVLVAKKLLLNLIINIKPNLMKYLSISLLFLIAMCQKDDEETCLIDQPDLNVICIEIYQPVCGCDKVTYSNNCYASASGISSWVDGECTD